MKVYDIITNRILERLEQGTIPWHQAWSVEMPKNLLSKKEYRGINVFLLGAGRYSNPYWLTFKQAKQLGGHVSKGEKSTPVVFWKWLEQEQENPKTGQLETISLPLLRYYNVFNVQQCEGIPAEKIPTVETTRKFHPIDVAEKTVQECPSVPSFTRETHRLTTGHLLTPCTCHHPNCSKAVRTTIPPCFMN